MKNYTHKKYHKTQNNHKAVISESIIYKRLLDEGINVEWTAIFDRRSRADFVTPSGKTIDVKICYSPRVDTCKKNTTRYDWYFNCQHHGKKQEGIDFYICMLIRNDEKTNYKPEPHTFVFPSKQANGLHIIISSRMLDRGKFDFFEDNFDLIKDAEKGERKHFVYGEPVKTN